MKKLAISCVVAQMLVASVAIASINPPTVVKGKDTADGTTSDPRISCRMELLSHGKVECELTLTGTLLNRNWVMLNLRDGTEHVILSAQLEEIVNKDKKTCVYRFYVDQTAVKNSYIQIPHTKRSENLWVLLESVKVHDDWTHRTGANK